MIRGTFANIRLRNQLAPGTEGGVTRHLPDGEQMSIYDAAQRYQADGVPLVILAGKEYGSGSSRDWAAKGTALLGVRAVLAESFERIHRCNLVGMGILPLQFKEGDTAESLGLTGEEVFDITGLEGLADGAPLPDELTGHGAGRRGRSPCVAADRHPQGGGVLPPRRHPALRAAPATRRLDLPASWPICQPDGGCRPLAGSRLAPPRLRASPAWPGPGRSAGPAGAAPRPTSAPGQAGHADPGEPAEPPRPPPVAGRMAGP